MRNIFLFIILLQSFFVNGQHLDLTVGQKINYEYLSIQRSLDFNDQSMVNYSDIIFEVLKISDTTVILKVNHPRLINNVSLKKRIFDSKFSYEKQERDIEAIANKVLSEMSFKLIIDRDGNFIKVEGVDAIRNRILEVAKSLDLSDINQQHTLLINSIFTAQYFKRTAEVLFKKPSVLKGEKKYTKTGMQVSYANENGTWKKVGLESLDTISVFVRGNINSGNKLLESYTLDSTCRGVVIPDKKFNNQTVLKILLKINKGDKFNIGSSLFSTVNTCLDLENYYSSVNTAMRGLEDLKAFHYSKRGMPGIDKIIYTKLDSLDNTLRRQTFKYKALKLGILQFLDYKAYLDLIAEIPVDSLIEGYQVIEKSKCEYHLGNREKFLKSVKLFFNKFRGNGYYIDNTHLLAEFIHSEIAKSVFNSKDTDTLRAAHLLLEKMEAFKIPQLTEILGSLRSYVVLKLTPVDSDPEAILEKKDNGVFSHYGRYRLLIFDELTLQNRPDSVKNIYIDYTIEMLKSSLSDLATEKAKAIYGDFFFNNHLRDQRIYLRKYLSDAYFRKNSLFPANPGFLQLASEYMQDQQDLLADNGSIENEYYFLPYIDYNKLFVENDVADKNTADKVLDKLLDMVILEPERYVDLQNKYNQIYPGEDFKMYFRKSLKEKLPKASDFVLYDRYGKEFSNTKYANKHIFIDFWGTWCKACINEIQYIENLHNQNKSSELLVKTIACFDKKEYVSKFMLNNKYSFDVLMSDERVQKKYHVSSYPKKVLILPIGVFVVIPYSQDYRAIVEKYLAWGI
ncbi:redoxin domain-containing protein [Pedobacter sp. AW31-3R]|uniref:redoxin domain-containing protein n=1 Tax=Pedobacter sp. AW31-3R TaxID=3445781 RepID=UPI003FA0489A